MPRVTDDSEHEFSDYENLAQKKALGCLCACCWDRFFGRNSSVLRGFIGKLLLFSVAFETKLFLSIVAMVIGVVISNLLLLRVDS